MEFSLCLGLIDTFDVYSMCVIIWLLYNINMYNINIVSRAQGESSGRKWGTGRRVRKGEGSLRF